MHSTRLRLAWLALLALLMLSACGAPYEFKGVQIQAPTTAPDFTLTDQHGQPFRLSEQRGKVVLLFFGFASCPDICPTTLADIAAARRELGADGEKVQVAFITVDPERDTPEITGQYVERFDPSFLGLHGTPAELEAVMKAYGVTAIKRDLPDSALGYTIDHSTYTYAIDPAGRWRSVFPFGIAVADIASDTRFLVQNGGS